MESEKTNQQSAFNDEPWRRSYMGLPAVVGDIDGVPIYAYGRVFIYGVSPTFESGVAIQQGAQTPQVKIKPKKIWEMRGNYLGAMVSWEPCMPSNDVQPRLAVNLIDGDPATLWMSRREAQPGIFPVWIRVDLSAEEDLSEIVLSRTRAHRPPDTEEAVSVTTAHALLTNPWPPELTVKVSRDALHWTDVYKGDASASLKPDEPLTIRLPESTRAKQIWIVADQTCCFTLSNIEALDKKGENVALLTRGAGVTVSSTDNGLGSPWYLNDQMWPIHYDLGASWLRLSGSNFVQDYDTLLWRFVEQEQGKYIGDPKTRLAMGEATENGCRVDVILSYGNWIYAGHPEYAGQGLDARTFPSPEPPAPHTREGFEGYKNWVRFMADYYRGTVEYWEIQNEPHGAFGWQLPDISWEDKQVLYCDLVKETAPVIRETDPNAKVALAGQACSPWNGSPLTIWLDMGVGPLVDCIGWHIQNEIIPGTELWDRYPDAVRDMKKYAESKGFRGEYVASEYWRGAAYPSPDDDVIEVAARGGVTEIRKAKDIARVYAMNAGLGVATMYCNTWLDRGDDCGLFRNTFASDPMVPFQPEAGYYIMRTLSTVLDGVEPMDLEVEFSAKERIDSYGFSHVDGALMLGVWLPGESVDKHPGVMTDVIIRAACDRVVGVDTLNGVEQDLQFRQDGDRVVIPGVVVRDYPLILRLEVGI